MTELNKQIELAITQLDRQFGKGSVIRLSDAPQPWPSVSTGALSLDLALGIGGLPRGRIVEIWGPEGAGKSTLALTLVANAQKQGGTCLYLDVEQSLDPLYASNLGVDLPNLWLSQPAAGEEAIDILETIVKTGEISVAVVDSVAALVPRAELEGGMSDNLVGAQPRLMAKAMRKLVGVAAETKTLIVFLNQVREKVGVMFGNPNISPGGRALKFFASTRIELSKVEDIKNAVDGSMIGTKVRAKIVKNRNAPPLRKAEFDIVYGKGIIHESCVFELGLAKDLISKKGAWFSYGEQQLGQGRSNAIEYLIENKELMEKLTTQIKEVYK